MATDYDALVKELREHRGWALNETLDAAADAIEALVKSFELSKEYEVFWHKEAEEALRRFQLAIANKPRWIPVSERLPEQNEFVLVANDEGKMIVARCNRLFREWYFKYCLYDDDLWDEQENGKATHWMPLPEPPKEET